VGLVYDGQWLKGQAPSAALHVYVSFVIHMSVGLVYDGQ